MEKALPFRFRSMVIQLHRELADRAREAFGHVLDATDRLVREPSRDDSRASRQAPDQESKLPGTALSRARSALRFSGDPEITHRLPHDLLPFRNSVVMAERFAEDGSC